MKKTKQKAGQKVSKQGIAALHKSGAAGSPQRGGGGSKVGGYREGAKGRQPKAAAGGSGPVSGPRSGGGPKGGREGGPGAGLGRDEAGQEMTSAEVRAKIAADPTKAAKLKRAQEHNAATAKALFGKKGAPVGSVSTKTAEAPKLPKGVKVPKEMQGKTVHVLAEIKFKGRVPESWKDFHKYLDGKTVEENVAHGIDIEGLEWDLEVELVELK